MRIRAGEPEVLSLQELHGGLEIELTGERARSR